MKKKLKKQRIKAAKLAIKINRKNNIAKRKSEDKKLLKKRIIVAFFVLLLTIMNLILIATGNFKYFFAISIAIIIGVIFIIKGKLPNFLYDFGKSENTQQNSLKLGSFAFRRYLTRDDDPSNISVKIYLPIILLVIAIVMLLFLWQQHFT
ncbi:hypothetical protein AAEX28_06265 [Lentisphaerota bacterium WC36G]|nr:hypothetical protein LJT99_09130 [Lentisphaerae bacterium WC36]